MSKSDGRTRRASDQTVLVARHASPKPTLVHVHLVAPITLIAHDESEPSTGFASPGVHHWQPLDQPRQLPTLVQPSDLLGPTNASTPDEDHWKSQIVAPNDTLQLVQGLRVDRYISFIDRDSEPADDGSDGPAVLESLADHAEAGVEDHDHPRVTVGEGWGGVVGRASVVVGRGPETEDRVGDPDPVENGGPSGAAEAEIGFGFGLFLLEEGLDVLKG